MSQKNQLGSRIMEPMNHELLLIKAFVIKERQERYINLIATAKGRKKFRTYTPHFKDLNAKYCTPLHSLRSYSQLHELLKSDGAFDMCYIISENSQYDTKSFSLINAAMQLFNSGIACFISCIPGKLVYYAGEEGDQRFLLKA